MTVCREVLKEQHALMVPTEHNPHDSQRELGAVSLACPPEEFHLKTPHTFGSIVNTKEYVSNKLIEKMPLKNMSIRPSDPAPEGVKLFGKDGRKKCDKLREFKMRWHAQNKGWNHSPRWKQYLSTITTVISCPAGHTAPHQPWQHQGWQWSDKHMSCCYRKALTLQSAVPGPSGPPSCSTKSSTCEHCPSEDAMTCWPRLTLQTLVQPSPLATHGWRCPAVVSCFTPCAAGPCHALGWALLSCQGEAQALSRQL